MIPGKYFGAHWAEKVVLLCAGQMSIVMTYSGDVNPIDDFKMKFQSDYKFKRADFISRIIFPLLLCLYSMAWTKPKKKKYRISLGMPVNEALYSESEI